MRSTAIVALMAIAAFVLSCSSGVEPLPEPLSEYEELRQQLAKSPRPDEEAELMALWMSGYVVAHQRDYDRVRAAVELVRETYRDSIPYLDSVEFTYDLEISMIAVLLDEQAVSQLRDDSYTDWDSLNELFRVAEIDTTSLEYRGEVTLTFEGRLNPSLLSAYYNPGLVQGIRGSGVYVPSGDHSNIYPWTSGSDFMFLLRRAWGDCSSWCPENQFWYFKVVDGEALYVGSYYAVDPYIFPEWWGEASVPFCRYIPHHELCGYY